MSCSTMTTSSMTDASMQIIKVTLSMDTVNFLGISIVGQTNEDGVGGIYVGSIMKGGAVAQDGRIEPGDMLLEVNDINFENMTNDDAVRTLREIVQQPGPVSLLVAKCWDPEPIVPPFEPRLEPIRPIDPSTFSLASIANDDHYMSGILPSPREPASLSSTSPDGSEHDKDTSEILQNIEPCGFRSSSLASVPFLDPIASIKCDSSGGVYHDQVHDFTIRIPKGAIPEGAPITIEIGVTLYGPFQFPTDLKPCSPVVWLCVRNPEDFEFKRPVEISLPHYLDVTSQDDVSTLQMTFLEANHALDVNSPYKFDEADGTATFEVQSSQGTLSTNHFCFLCVAANLTPKDTAKVNYCLVQVQPSPMEVHFCVAYFLRTCIQSVKRQYPSAHRVTTKMFRFADSGEDARLQISFPQKIDRGWMLALGSDSKVSASDVDFWDREHKELDLMHQEAVYPPRFSVEMAAEEMARIATADFHFDGAHENLDVQIILRPTDTAATYLDKKGPPASPVPKPTLRDLVRLPAIDWYTVSLELELDEGDLDTISKDNPLDDAKARRDMYRLWLRRCSDLSFQELVNALYQSGHESVAESLRLKYGLPVAHRPLARGPSTLSLPVGASLTPPSYSNYPYMYRTPGQPRHGHGVQPAYAWGSSSYLPEDYPTNEELEEVTKEVMEKLHNWTDLQVFLSISEDAMQEIQSQPTIRQGVNLMLRTWRDRSNEGSRTRLAECLKAADQKLHRAASNLVTGKYRTLSLTPSSSRNSQ